MSTAKTPSPREHASSIPPKLPEPPPMERVRKGGWGWEEGTRASPSIEQLISTAKSPSTRERVGYDLPRLPEPPPMERIRKGGWGWTESTRPSPTIETLIHSDSEPSQAAGNYRVRDFVIRLLRRVVR